MYDASKRSDALDLKRCWKVGRDEYVKYVVDML
jgi:hypothetical protein